MIVNKMIFLDKEGYIFDEAPYFSGEVYFKFYGLSDVGRSNVRGYGNPIFLQITFEIYHFYSKSSEGMKLRPVALDVTPDGDIKYFSLGVNDRNKSRNNFKADADFQKVAENLKAVLTTEPLQSNLKNKYSSFLYIDLRFGNKGIFQVQFEIACKEFLKTTSSETMRAGNPRF